MVTVKQVKMIVPSELLYAFDTDAEDVFIVAREHGRLVARPVSEYGTMPECDECCTHARPYASGVNLCADCRHYDGLCDQCRLEFGCGGCGHG